MELIAVDMCTGRLRNTDKKHLHLNVSSPAFWVSAQGFHWRTKQPGLTKEEIVIEKKNPNPTRDHFTLSDAHLNTRCCVVHPNSVAELRTARALPFLPVCSGGRILILVRQADPRFTPRVWLVPIVHCQGLLMGSQQWILSPHKWLSDRAPSSITSYNVEVQKMGPAGGLIWCFICSIEKLFSFPFLPPLCKITTVQACSHMFICKQNKSAQNYVEAVLSVRGCFLIWWTRQHLTWMQTVQQ